MQTETTTPSDAQTRTTSPRSAKRVLLYFAIGIFAGLALLILLITLFYSPGPTPLEQKLLGRWKQSSGTGDERVFTFRPDGTVFYASDGTTVYHWNADGATLQVSYQEDWWTDLWQRLTGSDTQTYELRFDNDDAFEIVTDSTTGQELFKRIKQ